MKHKTHVGAWACPCTELCIICDCNLSESPRINQAIRLPSATRYYLKRYREDLLAAAQSGNTSAATMLQAVDYILTEADKQEGVQ